MSADQQPVDALDSIAAAMVAAREASGLTRREVAERMGVRVDLLSRWERGENDPRATSFVAYMNACGLVPQFRQR